MVLPQQSYPLKRILRNVLPRNSRTHSTPTEGLTRYAATQNNLGRVRRKNPVLLNAHCDTRMGTVSRVHRVSVAASANWGAEPLWRIAEQKPATACRQIVVASEPRNSGSAAKRRHNSDGVASPGQAIPVNPLILARAEATRGLRRTPRTDDDAFLAHSRLLPRTRPRHVLQTFLRPCEFPRASQKQCPAV